MTAIVNSPAKVNYYLQVIRKRKDGYHEILSLMQRISLSDEMAFSPRKDGVVLHCPDGGLPEDERNIVHRAASLFISHFKPLSGVEITLKKNIPVAAGLGGGSSNAATTLMTMNDLAGSPFTQRELIQMGAKLGADVPFFIFKKPAWATGIGEELSPAPPLPPLWLVLINPGFPVSTASVFRDLNLELTNHDGCRSIHRFSSINELICGLRNDLEEVTIRRYPILDRFKALLIDHGALGALMSGSGPTVFGIFTDEDSASLAENALRRAEKCFVLKVCTI